MHAFENEFEPQYLRAVLLAVNGTIHSGKIIQPVLAHWKYTGKYLVKFLPNIEKQITFARKEKYTHKTGSSKYYVANDFLSLVNEKVLVTLACFLHIFQIKYFLTHFNIMQKHESPC